MNKKRSLILALMLGILFTGISCTKPWNEPEFKTPSYLGRANKKITELKRLHTLGNAPDSIFPRRDFIFEAWVMSSDEEGNFNKSLFLQDATGGIELLLDESYLFNRYPLGQKVFVNARYLVVGDHHYAYQLGWKNQDRVIGIHSIYMNQYISRDSLPGSHGMPSPTPVTNAADLSANEGKLVSISGCSFTETSIGRPLAYRDTEFTEHPVIFNNTEIYLKTSANAKFRNIQCLDQEFDLVGILIRNGDRHEIMLRSGRDILYTGL